MKTTLVLEGGAMRGMYTAGVLDTFMDYDLPVDAIIGVSAGALFGINYPSRQRGRVIRYSKRFNRNRRYMGLRPLLREGAIVSPSFAYGTVPCELDPFDDETYRQAAIPFTAVVTDIHTGEPVYMPIRSVYEDMDILRASGSMPFVSKPVPLGDSLYLDGAVTDSIPFARALADGADKLIVILTRDAAYRKGAMSPALVKLMYRKYPRLIPRLLTRHEMYNCQLEELAVLEREGRAFVIRPDAPIAIGRMEKNPDRLQAVYDSGIRDGVAALPRLSAYLAAP